MGFMRALYDDIQRTPLTLRGRARRSHRGDQSRRTVAPTEVTPVPASGRARSQLARLMFADIWHSLVLPLLARALHPPKSKPWWASGFSKDGIDGATQRLRGEPLRVLCDEGFRLALVLGSQSRIDEVRQTCRVVSPRVQPIVLTALDGTQYPVHGWDPIPDPDPSTAAGGTRGDFRLLATAQHPDLAGERRGEARRGGAGSAVRWMLVLPGAAGQVETLTADMIRSGACDPAAPVPLLWMT